MRTFEFKISAVNKMRTFEFKISAVIKMRTFEFKISAVNKMRTFEFKISAVNKMRTFEFKQTGKHRLIQDTFYLQTYILFLNGTTFWVGWVYIFASFLSNMTLLDV